MFSWRYQSTPGGTVAGVGVVDDVQAVDSAPNAPRPLAAPKLVIFADCENGWLLCLLALLALLACIAARMLFVACTLKEICNRRGPSGGKLDRSRFSATKRSLDVEILRTPCNFTTIRTSPCKITTFPGCVHSLRQSVHQLNRRTPYIICYVIM